MNRKRRIENDGLGEVSLPAESLWGSQTARVAKAFPLLHHPVPPQLICAYGQVKLACAVTNRTLGFWSDHPARADAIESACCEMADGLLSSHIIVHSLQGGAGTGTNMNVNEVLANRALQILGGEPGQYEIISPLNDINRHQSTNDTYPTALKLAAILSLRSLEEGVVMLQEAFQRKEHEFAHIVKVGRTQLQDAVLTTLGRSMGAYAEVLGRDRWRIYKCEERLRMVNLGGTAIGTGLAAPRRYIFAVVETLREQTGIGFARAENLLEATQNVDQFVEASGLLKTLAVSLIKITSDLRTMASGPDAGFSEIRLPIHVAGSSIMPGKVNPIIPEGVAQAAMKAIGSDFTLTQACSMGNLELNPFLPVVASSLLESLAILDAAVRSLATDCVSGIEANEQRCRELVENSAATITALVPKIGYKAAEEIIAYARANGMSLREASGALGAITDEEFAELTSPEAVCRLGDRT
jgi:aspartate ammonia-lyase